MKQFLLVFSIIVALAGAGFAYEAQAHRSGCHRWHSCESDTESYICGDTGYCSQCPDNEFCHSGLPIGARNNFSGGNNNAVAPVPAPPPTPETTSQLAPTAQPTPSVFTGFPKTRRQLLSCRVVGNYKSMIYHTKGSRFIRGMNLKNKECFAAEPDAVRKGFRKAKTR